MESFTTEGPRQRSLYPGTSHSGRRAVPGNQDGRLPHDAQLSDHSRRTVPGNQGLRRSYLLEQSFQPAELKRLMYQGRLDVLAHGLYAAPPADDSGEQFSRSWLALQALTGGTERVVSHETAAAVYGMLPGHLRPPFHITVPRTQPQVRRPGLVVGHRAEIPESQRAVIAGVPLTSPARTWVDLALRGSLDEAVVLADIVLRPPRPEWERHGPALASKEELLHALRDRRRTKGIRVAREAARLARVGVDSPMETRLRLALYRAGLPAPQVNPLIRDDHGRELFQPDLGFEDYKTAVQYEGGHHSSPLQVEKDVARAERAEAHGWLEVRITRRHARNSWEDAIRKVRRALISRGWRP